MEQWHSINERYEVSNLGNARSLDFSGPVGKRKAISYKGQPLKPQKTKEGYRVIQLLIDGKAKKCKMHRLVAQAFLPNPENLPVVNHINGVKHDNRVENLEWSSQGDNNRHSVATGLHRTNSKSGALHYKSLVVLHTTTGVFYESLLDASRAYGDCSGTHFKKKLLNGHYPHLQLV